MPLIREYGYSFVYKMNIHMTYLHAIPLTSYKAARKVPHIFRVSCAAETMKDLSGAIATPTTEIELVDYNSPIYYNCSVCPI
jgi:hypothetical protein